MELFRQVCVKYRRTPRENNIGNFLMKKIALSTIQIDTVVLKKHTETNERPVHQMAPAPQRQQKRPVCVSSENQLHVSKNRFKRK
jgi:hypothetical protein